MNLTAQPRALGQHEREFAANEAEADRHASHHQRDAIVANDAA